MSLNEGVPGTGCHIPGVSGEASFRFRKDTDGKWGILRREDKFNIY